LPGPEEQGDRGRQCSGRDGAAGNSPSDRRIDGEEPCGRIVSSRHIDRRGADADPDNVQDEVGHQQDNHTGNHGVPGNLFRRTVLTSSVHDPTDVPGVS
jgi:hypothetical protein